MRAALFKFFGVVKTVILAVFVASLFSKWLLPRLPVEWRETGLSRWLTDYESEIPAILLILIGLIDFTLSRIRDPGVVQELQDLLDGIRQRYEEKTGGRPVRATLFRYREGLAVFSWTYWRCAAFRTHGRRNPTCWHVPWAGWMLPVARSGDSGRKTRTAFVCPSDSEDEAEGIAGRCRFQAPESLVVRNLPEVLGPTSPSVREYAEAAFVSELWVRSRMRKRKSMPRDFLGIPILDAGNLWGALVLDSDEPDRISESNDRCDSIMMTALVGIVRRL